MTEGQTATQELIAGRYWPQEVVHREEGRTGWHGQDVGLHRPVTLMESRPAPGTDARRTAARILRESETMELACPGRVAAVFDVVEENGALWTVMDRIEGAPLNDLARHGPVSCVRTARTGLAILDVLAAAHREGITHGDLSPGQVFVRADGGVLVTGFGVLGAASSRRVTAPSYASPEQARGEGSAPAADLWALGAILYTMVEGRPPVRDRGPVDATLRAVDLLPIRSPLSAGPLGPAIQGLLRRDPQERLPEPVVRAAFTRILREDPGEPKQAAPLPCLRDAYAAARRTGRVWSRRSVGRPALLGVVALVVAGVSLAALALTGGGSDGGSSAARPAPFPPTAGGPADGNPPASRPPASRSPSPSSPSASPSASASPSPSASSGGDEPPAGFQRYEAREGFSIALPTGWKAVARTGSSEVSYRVTFGAPGDPRTLAITYSERLGPDPVDVWRALEPSLKRASVRYERVGEIRAVDYRGYDAADLEWLSDSEGVRERTLGRGFVIGSGRGFSFRWTTPAADWDDTANRRALEVFLSSFRASGT
ncbi:serine/threonine protein kinase [Streptomyces sp. NPDC005551]|uniref:protein kinase domain-containing protein n=1 Tax=Streptomyces sp. NPDC005551 TaxID=3364725 RepID=UPI0036852697